MGGPPIPQHVVRHSHAARHLDGHLLNMRAASAKVIALVDTVVLSRDCLVQSLLPRLGPQVTIEPFASIAELMASKPSRFDLLLYYGHDNTGDNIRVALEAVADSPMPVLVITNDSVAELDWVSGQRVWSGLCGLVSTADTDSNLLSAGIRFVLSGGTFFPLEMIVRHPQAAPAPPRRKTPGALTARQSEVFAKLQQGKPNKLIAYELGMSESTVKVHIRSIMSATGARNRTQAVSLARQRSSMSTGSGNHD